LASPILDLVVIDNRLAVVVVLDTDVVCVNGTISNRPMRLVSTNIDETPSALLVGDLGSGFTAAFTEAVTA
jgi:hypothetical protein